MYEFFIAPFVEYPFLRRALIASLMIAISSGFVGVFLVLNRMSLIGDALSHGILPGIALGFLFFGFNLVAMSLGGVIAGIVIALLSALISQRTNLKEDASLAALYLLSLSVGVIIIAKSGSQADLMHILFGSVLAIDRHALIFVWLVLVGTLLILAIIYRYLLLYIVDPMFLKSVGIRGVRYYYLFLLLVVFNLVASFQALGTLMTVGLLMIPAISARLWTHRMEGMFAYTLVFGVIASYLGLLFSYHTDVPTGPMIILSTGVIYIASVLFGGEGGVFSWRKKEHRVG